MTTGPPGARTDASGRPSAMSTLVDLGPDLEELLGSVEDPPFSDQCALLLDPRIEHVPVAKSQSPETLPAGGSDEALPAGGNPEPLPTGGSDEALPTGGSDEPGRTADQPSEAVWAPGEASDNWHTLAPPTPPAERWAMNELLHEADQSDVHGATIDPNTLRQMVAEAMAAEGTTPGKTDDRRYRAEEILDELLERAARERLSLGHKPMSVDQELATRQSVVDSLFGMGPLQRWIDDPDVENIDVNGPHEAFATYNDGAKVAFGPIVESDQELIDLVRWAGGRWGLSDRPFDNTNPEIDLRLPDGSRLSALMAVSRSPVISIRRHRYLDLTLQDLVRIGTLNRDLASLLDAAVRARKNIVVAGAMNVGKTTLMRALAASIPSRERLVTIEQAFELGLDAMRDRHPDIVALEARPANSEGVGVISMAQLVRRALRMNADRVIVGECLGDEVIPMLNAMSQGRAGSMCTIHANSSSGVFRRIASYAVQAPERLALEATNLLVAGSIDLVVYLDRARSSVQHVTEDGSPSASPRFVSSIREVTDAEQLQVISNEIYRPGPDRRALPHVPLRSDTLEELVEHGYDPGLASLGWEDA